MKNIPIYNFHILLYFFIIKSIICQSDECEFDKPLKMGNNYLSTYFSILQFKSGDCIISNSKIKTQWLNNILVVGGINFRFIKFMISSNVELILSTSSCLSNKYRIY